MMQKTSNIFQSLPIDTDNEVFEDIVSSSTTRIERIISTGQTSPETGWYDQHENEWVIVLKGSAILEFPDGATTQLYPGDYINIPAHTRHRVSWTDPSTETIWLAVFYP